MYAPAEHRRSDLASNSPLAIFDVLETLRELLASGSHLVEHELTLLHGQIRIRETRECVLQRIRLTASASS